MADFERLGVCPELIQAVAEEGWVLPTPIQDEAIPLILGGGDVCAAAETGSGKTGAFALPCLQVVYEILQHKAMTTVSGRSDSQRAEFVLNANDKDPFVSIDENKVEARSYDERRWAGVRASNGILKGKYMFEAEVLGPGLLRVGWSSTTSPSRELGVDTSSFGFGGTGKKSWNRTFEDYGEPFGYGDIIGCLLDRDAETIEFVKNGKHLGVAFTVPARMFLRELQMQVRVHFDKPLAFPVAGFRAVARAEPGHHAAGLTADTERDRDRQQRAQPLCVVLEPTRDLAEQTYRAMIQYGRYLQSPALRIGLFIGGGNDHQTHDTLRSGVDIAVGTLQKLMYHVSHKHLDLSKMQLLVLDEADDLIRNDDNNSLLILKNSARPEKRVQVLFFSATLHSVEVRRAINSITSNPTWVDLRGRPSVPDTVHFVCYYVDATSATLPCPAPSTSVFPPTDGIHQGQRQMTDTDVWSANAKLLKPQLAVSIADALEIKSCLIFCRTNLDCDNFEKYLIALGGGKAFRGVTETGKENPYSCVVLAGMRNQEERRANLEYFKNGSVRFLVCTDVAARGIDIKELPYVIMLTLPDDPDLFFHRVRTTPNTQTWYQVGRVGRADVMGLAISIVSTKKEKVWYHRCPNRGRGCSNIKLVDNGGCCIWYDELACLRAIEGRIGSTVPVMDPVSFSVPGIIDLSTSKPHDGNGINKHNLGRRGRLMVAVNSDVNTAPAVQSLGKLVIYGKSQSQRTDQVALERLHEISARVEELQKLEDDIQRNFTTLLVTGIPHPSCPEPVSH